MWRHFAALALAGSAGLIIATFAASGEPLQPAQTAVTPTPTLPSGAGGARDWILLDGVPPGSPPIEYGREIYRLACSACHGDKGQGLTTEWRMTWGQQDQNCWQSKCHSLNHPPDGFFLPYSPPVTTLIRSRRYSTALDLHRYIQATMPWHDQGSLTDERTWQVTLYVLKLNNFDVAPEFTVENAAGIRLVPERATAVPAGGAVATGEVAARDTAESPAPTAASDSGLLPFAAALVAILLACGGVLLWRSARR
jgi:hypothetical protein